MAYQQGTATDYQDLLTKLVEFATGDSVETVAVAAGGTGYVVGDILTASGGTTTHAATFEVTSVSGGVVDGIIVVEHGTYTATPSNPVSTTGGTGSGCTLTLTWQDTGWQLLRETQEAVSATVAVGGSGYIMNDKLTVYGGVGVTEAAVFNVDTVDGGGAVLTVSLDTDGSYAETPGNPVATTGGTGSGCTLNVTWQALVDEPKEVILQGEGSGTDEIFVGIRTYSVSLAYNWELSGMTGYSASLEFDNQPGINPGRYDGATYDGGAYVPLNNASMTYWFFVDGRRILFVVNIGTTYVNGYLGFIDQFGDDTDYPYPLLVLGCSSKPSRLFSDTSLDMSGLCDPMASKYLTYPYPGPGFLRLPGGTWKAVRNSEGIPGSSRAKKDEDVVVFPCGQGKLTTIATEDLIFLTSTNVSVDGVVPMEGMPGTVLFQILESPGDDVALFPAVLYETYATQAIYGELRGVSWVSANRSGGQLTTEDTIDDGSDIYIVFQNCNRSDAFVFVAIKRE